MLHTIQIETRGRELRDFGTSSAADFHLEDMSSDQRARGAFVHGEEAVSDPVPAVIAVRVVYSDHHLHLRLSPKAGAVRWTEPHAGVEVGIGVFPIRANQFDAGLVIRILAQIIVR